MAYKTVDIRRTLSGMGYQSSLGNSILGKVAVEGTEVVKRNLADLIDRMAEAAYGRTKKAAEDLKLMSQRIVPYDEGHLFGTARITQMRDAKSGRFATEKAGSWIVSYGGMSDTGIYVDYAMIVHENWRGDDYNAHEARGPYPGPKMSHYLSTPAEVMRGRFLTEVADDVKEAVVAAITEAKGSAPAPRISMTPRLVKRR